MSEGNGKNRILSLDGARQPMRKGSDFITRDQCNALIVEECTKVHEFYMQQIPQFTARMIQDALMSYGLIVATPEAQLAAVPEGAGDATAAPAEPAEIPAAKGDEQC